MRHISIIYATPPRTCGPFDFDVCDVQAAAMGDGGEAVDWGELACHAPDAWRTSRGEGALVAVIDTGVAPHPDLPAGAACDFTGCGSTVDAVGHGTHVAGIVGARGGPGGVAGIAPACEMLYAKAIPGEGAQCAQAIRWAVAQGADVINMSWGQIGEDDPALRAACVDAAAAGALLVAAAGNGYVAGQDTVAFPARYPEVIAVAALDPGLHHAYFSSAGAPLENGCSFPGVNILSTWKGGTYARLTGTSMAAPMLAGTLALWVGRNRSVPRERRFAAVQQELTAISDRRDDFTFTGRGLPDLARL